jgi:hypothetical protein
VGRRTWHRQSLSSAVLPRNATVRGCECCLAADRTMQAARASQDPVTIGSSARIVTRAMSRAATSMQLRPRPAHPPRTWTGMCPLTTPNRSRCTARSCCVGRSPPPGTTTDTQPTNCSQKPRTPPRARAKTATCVGQHSARPTPSSTGSTSRSPSASRNRGRGRAHRQT